MRSKFIYVMLVAMLATLGCLPGKSQVRVGVRAGFTLDKMRFDRNIISSDNRMGYHAGLLLDFNIPVVGLGVEASVMYTHRNNRLTDNDRIYKRHYIDIPVYARYRMALRGIEHVVAPLFYTGPAFSVLFSENAPANYKNSKTYLSWDVGGGVDLFRHLRVTVTYGLGMSRALKVINREYDGEQVTGKDSHWTLSAAYLF